MHVYDMKTAKLIQWVWFLLRGDTLPFFEGHHWNLPKTQAELNEEVLASIEPTFEIDNSGQTLPWNMHLMSHNVMAIGAGLKDKWRKGPGLLEVFCHQMADEAVHAFSTQEARLRTAPSKCNKLFHFFHTEPNKEGNGGLLVGFSRLLPLGRNRDDTNVLLREQDIRLIHGDPFLLILHVKNEMLELIFITGQAPHSGRPESEIQQWWKNVSQFIPKKYAAVPRLFGGDANAKVGSFQSRAVGPWQAEEDNLGGRHFQTFLEEEKLWLPCTWEQCQFGPGWTWCHPRGTTSRIDYFAVPESWRAFGFKTWVQKDNILNSLQHDHSAVKVMIQGWSVAGNFQKEKKKTSMYRLDLNDLNSIAKLEKAMQQTPAAPWTQDVHTQVHEMQNQIKNQAFDILKPMPRLRKEYLQRDTWEMITKKKELKRSFFAAKDEKAWWNLKLYFVAWKGSEHEIEEAFAWRSRLNIEEAETSWYYRKVSMHAQSLVRRDDESFFEDLIRRFTNFDSSSTQKEFWREVRRQNSRTKEKKKTLKAEAIECLKDEWVPHLCRLECGEVVTAARLYQECIQRQNEQKSVTPTLMELPSLLQIELTLKNTKAGKAPGPDQLSSDVVKKVSGGISRMVWEVAMKCALWQIEPVQWKGGRLIHIPKPGAPKNKIEGFRGIMLTSAISKRLQSLTRSQLVTLLEGVHPRGQLGGYQKKESVFGAHLVRALNKTAYQARCSSATLYVDVRTAYHALIRSLITGLNADSLAEHQKISNQLRDQGLQILSEEHPTMAHGVLKSLEASEFLQKTAQEVNRDTWSLLQTSLVRTAKGSRPGSPLADIFYMLAMNEAGHLMQTLIDEDEQIQTAAKALKVDVPVVIWADDIAVPLLCQDCTALLGLIEIITRRVTEILAERGLQTNFGRAKTEVVVTPAGQGAREVRQQLLQNPHEGIDVDHDAGTKVRVQGKYKHLGCQQSSAGGLTHELRYRVALTWSGFREVRSMLCRRQYSLQTRLKLADALLWSRLFHGAGAWGPLRPKQLDILSRCYWGIVRAIAGQGFKKASAQGVRPWSNAKLQAQLGIPDVLTKLTSARLLYGRRLWLHGGASLKQVVQREYETCE